MIVLELSFFAFLMLKYVNYIPCLLPDLSWVSIKLFKNPFLPTKQNFHMKNSGLYTCIL